jgi:nitrogenase subunit NifH
MCEIEKAPLLRMGGVRPHGRAATQANQLAAIHGDCHRILHSGDSPRLDGSSSHLWGVGRDQHAAIQDPEVKIGKSANGRSFA